MTLDHLAPHVRGLGALAARLLRDHHAGEDLAQDAFLRAAQAERMPEPSAGSGPWLRTIARRLASNERRSRARRRDAEASLALDRAGAAAPSSAEIAARAEVAQRLQERIRSLPPESAAVILDRYVGELSPTEIARRDGVSVNTVKARLRRARAALRESLEREGLRPGEPWVLGLGPLAAVHAHPPTPTLLIGATAMGKTLLTAAAAVALVIAAVLLGHGGDAEPTGGSHANPAPGPARIAVDDQQAPRADAIDLAGAREALGAVTESSGTSAEATLSGRVIDSSGAPIEGARARAVTTGWKDGERSTPHTATSWTNEHGRFELTVPVGERLVQRLTFTSGPFYVQAKHRFREGRGGRWSALGEETRELGDVVLARAGMARGRVVDDAGRGIPGATVEIGPGYSSSYGLIPETSTVTAADGTYELGHVSAGVLQVRFEKEGYASRLTEETRFRAGQETAMHEVVLNKAGTITGRVVDQDGNAVADADLSFRPAAENGASSRTKTAQDGSFRVQLKATGVHHVGARATGHVTINNYSDAALEVSPGAADVSITLPSVPTMTFRVVDGASGATVESFGIRIAQGKLASTARRFQPLRYARSRERERPGGLAVGPARAGVDGVVIDAIGYMPFIGDVTHDEGDPGTQTIALQRARAVVGRIERHGLPVQGARIAIVEDVHSNKSMVAEVTTDSRGSFRTPGVGPGTFEFRIKGPEARLHGSLVTEIPGADPDAEHPADFELAPIDLTGTGTVRGRVMLPTGAPLDGAFVYLGDWKGAELSPVLDDGSFSITDVPPGSHTLTVGAPPGRLGKVRSKRFEVREGEVTVLEVDASQGALGQVEITLTVDHPSIQAADCTAWLAWADSTWGPGRTRLRTPSGAVPEFDAIGRVTLEAPAPGTAFLQINPSESPSLTLVTSPLAVLPGATQQHQLHFLPATLEVEVPTASLPAEHESIALHLFDSRFVTPIQSFRIGLTKDRSRTVQVVDGVATLDFAATGDLTLEARWPSDDHRSSTERQNITLRPGQVTRVRLTGPPR